MSELQLSFTRGEDWIKKFNPHRRVFTGRSYHIVKRIMDLALVILSAPVWLPLMAITAVLIWVTDSRPVFFAQFRTGKGGRRFKMYKFRTMVKNAEDRKREFASVNEKGELSGPLKLQNDPRVTRVGRILRRTSLDELPQIINILLGDMSWVGPRPTSWSLESYKLWQTERLDILPGLTGLWQVFGRGGEDFDEWLRWDLRYIEKRSIWLDFLILVKTFTVFLHQRGAR